MKRVMLFGILVMALVAFTAASDQHNVMNCPLNVEGTNVAVMDTSTGIEITFATKAGESAVTELQRRVERLAKMHSGDLKLRDMMAGLIIPGDVEYELAPDGARLTLIPKDPNQVNAFRSQVREHVENMKNGKFPMMERMMKMMDERTKGDPSDPAGSERVC